MAARGMNCAKEKARQLFALGLGVESCPYKSPAWRTTFAAEMQRLQQQKLFN
jgi:hypothetical protein